MSDISVDIGQVVLSGISNPPANPLRFGQMTETALQRLLEQRGLPSELGGGDVPEVVVPDMSLPRNPSDRRIAEELAQAIYRALVLTIPPP